MKELGIDISTWQGGINYSDIKSKVKYAILRAGFSKTKDNQFDNHYNNLQGLNLGAYWYSYATTEDEARLEARTFLKVIEDRKFTLPLYLDIEDPSQRGLGRNTLNSIVRAFGEIIENAGYYFGVYTNLDWYRNVISGSELNKKYDWWIACWSNSAPGGADYGVWQYTNNLSIGGYRVDCNYILKDYPTIIKEAGLNHLGNNPIPTPTPGKKSNEQIANEVIAGLWGNGQERYNRLTGAGYDYNTIQSIVNSKLYTPQEITYTVQAGDSLSSIASKYNTTWQEIYNNNKSIIGNNPNLIYPGQVLKIRK